MDYKAALFYFILSAVTSGGNGAPKSRKLELRDVWNKRASEELNKRLNLQQNNNVAKNIVMFMGDGMGIPTVTGARIYKGQMAGNSGEETVLSFEEFPYVGLAKTYNTDRQVPDSAATATAIFTGVKTRFGLVGVDDRVIRGDCDSYRPEMDLKTIFFIAKEAGKSVALVTTSRLTHATPSAAYAHSPERWWEKDDKVPKACRGRVADVASQFVTNAKDFDVVFAGGRKYFIPNSESDPEYPEKIGGRTDGRNLIKEWEADKAGRNLTYKYVWRKKEFDQLEAGNYDRVLGLFDYDHMNYEGDRATDKAGEPSLVEMTEYAVKQLERNPNGYFLFVEGARIDHGHHMNLGKHALNEMVMMERSAELALSRASVDDTLFLVTGDHGHVMTVGGWASRGNPLFGIDDYQFGQDNMPYTTIMYQNGPSGISPGTRKNLSGVDTESFSFRQQSMVPLNVAAHGADDVPVYAHGPMAHLFHGVYEQNYILHAMTYASCMDNSKKHCKERAKEAKLMTSGGATLYVTLTSHCLVLLFLSAFH
ncbi:alkaline phosphatase-like isoform X1 [Lineus longissimus]|uniref:alkaline phosphatase-like isoform X1 n=1 Tax=Lineus longissimus TaxID=88925 RepID=UPI002B4D6977